MIADQQLATVAIVGRPNVGKSTLFNRILGRREAIVHEQSGVTRDRNFAKAEWNGVSFWLVDTGGVVPRSSDAMNQAIVRQVEQAVDAADVVMFVVDTLAGVHPTEPEIGASLRRTGKPLVLIANKADTYPRVADHLVFHALGLGDPVPVSAATGTASGDMLDRIVALLPERPVGSAESAINVAVVGRPNVGKSSIMNRLLGQDRALVSETPGTTRDAIDSALRFRGRTLNFIDTAGLRKRSRVAEAVEFYSTLRTERAVERADVCILVMDASDTLATQDLKIAEKAWSWGCGLIVAVNKWDLIDAKDSNTARRGETVFRDKAPFLEYVPFVYVSAKTGQRVRRLLDLVLEVEAERRKRVPTADANRVLEALIERQQPPQSVGRATKLFYASQVGTAPPVFAVISNRPHAIPESYRRYLIRGFRRAWGFTGAPIRLRLKRRRQDAA